MKMQIKIQEPLCETNSCTCQKHAIPCTSSCGECRGKECHNATKVIVHDDEDEDEKYDNTDIDM